MLSKRSPSEGLAPGNQHDTRTRLPLTGLKGLKENWRFDLLSGFQIFLIALPLSLGIAMASQVPPLAGIVAAIVGGLVVSLTSGSYVTINGPAAGLIVIIIGAVESLGQGDPVKGYHLTLAAIVVAGLIEIAFGLLRVGRASSFFPAPAVHGLLASIGIIIMAKQSYVMLGVKPAAKSPLVMLAQLPTLLPTLNPDIALIGLVSLAVLIILPRLGAWARQLPAPLVAVLAGIGVGKMIDLDHAHQYHIWGRDYSLGPDALLSLPQRISEGLGHPDFSAIGTSRFWFAVTTIALIASLESILSAAAVDKLDPYHRKTNLNKDIAAVGLGTTISGLLGGLPMIAEIVRSSANVNNGAKTGWSNFFHGCFLFLFVALAPGLLHAIPLASLAALLVYTGFRLASPKEFVQTYRIGSDQLTIFVVTILATLATDLLIGIGCGIATKILLHKLRGASWKALFRGRFTITEDGGTINIQLSEAAVFTNLMRLQTTLEKLPKGLNITVDCSDVDLIDHSVMEYLAHFSTDYERHGGAFSLEGLDNHTPTSAHPLASRTSGRLRRLTPGPTRQNRSA